MVPHCSLRVSTYSQYSSNRLLLADPRMNRNLDDYKTVPDHFCGCVRLFHYAKGLPVGLSYALYAIGYTMRPTDEYAVFSVYE